jgi:hypothetical protein
MFRGGRYYLPHLSALAAFVRISSSRTPVDCDRKHVFISHSWGSYDNDQRFHNIAVELKNRLSQKGYKVWLDKHEGNIADMAVDMKKSMKEGIENSDTMICLLSQKYHDKIVSPQPPGDPEHYVRYEFDHAKTLFSEGKVIPIIVDYEKDFINRKNWKKPFSESFHDYLKYMYIFSSDIGQDDFDMLRRDLNRMLGVHDLDPPPRHEADKYSAKYAALPVKNIVVIGSTNAGKSSFIRAMTAKDLTVGRRDKDKTVEWTSLDWHHGNCVYRFWDTAGFSSTEANNQSMKKRKEHLKTGAAFFHLLGYVEDISCVIVPIHFKEDARGILLSDDDHRNLLLAEYIRTSLKVPVWVLSTWEVNNNDRHIKAVRYVLEKNDFRNIRVVAGVFGMSENEPNPKSKSQSIKDSTDFMKLEISEKFRNSQPQRILTAPWTQGWWGYSKDLTSLAEFFVFEDQYKNENLNSLLSEASALLQNIDHADKRHTLTYGVISAYERNFAAEKTVQFVENCKKKSKGFVYGSYDFLPCLSAISGVDVPTLRRWETVASQMARN